MAELQIHCPHCATEHAGFTLQGSPLSVRMADHMTQALLICNVCGKGVVAFLDMDSSQAFEWTENRRIFPVTVIEYYPTPNRVKAPRHLPADVERFYLQARDALNRRHYDGAGAMFRKALQTAVRSITSRTDRTLYQEIEHLSADQGITPAMKQWANEIRQLGAGAAHDEFDKDDAEDIAAFTEMFLTYSMTMPEELNRRRAKKAK